MITTILQNNLKSLTERKIEELENQRINRLLSYIRLHGMNCQYGEGVILVEAVFSSENGTYTEIEEIEPNMQAVRNWLGY